MESEQIGIDDLIYIAGLETQMERISMWIPKGWGRLAYYSPWGHKESDTTEQLN